MKELALIGALLIFTTIPANAQDTLGSAADDPFVYLIDVDDKQYLINYYIEGGIVKSIYANNETLTVTVMIRALDDGLLEIYMPGGFLTRAFNIGPDLDAIVFVDALETLPEARRGVCDLTLRIPFQAGSERIDIVGTFIYPPDPNAKGQAIRASVMVEDREVRLDALTNADECYFSFDQEERRLHAELSSPQGETGYFQIALPHEFLGGPYAVLVNNQPIAFESVFYNATGRDNTIISFQYEGTGTNKVDIIGTTAIPEFTAVIGFTAMSVGVAALLLRFKLQKVL